MHALYELIGAYTVLVKSNPTMAGAISLYGMGVLTWALRNVPEKLWQNLKHQCTTTVVLDNTSRGTSVETYQNLMRWLVSSTWIKYSRGFSLSGTSGEDEYGSGGSIQLGIGPGTHFFIFKGRCFWVSRREFDKQQASYQILYTVTITMLGRKHNKLMTFIDQFKHEPDEDKLVVFGWKDYWSLLGYGTRRSLDSVFIAHGEKERLVRYIDEWKRSKAWYKQQGVSYKLTFLLHGPTGTGKTSLIRGLASHYSAPIYALSLTEMTDQTLRVALAKVPQNAFIVLEDVDSSDAVKSRGQLEGEETPLDRERDSDTKELSTRHSFLTLSGVLNAFDGLLSLDGRLIFLSTNVLDSIDSAMRRPGRIDHTVLIDYLQDSDIRAFSQAMYAQELSKDTHYRPIAGCVLQQLYMEHRNSFDDFVQALKAQQPQPVLKAA